MAFDKHAWDPTPAQFAGFAVIAAWIFAWLVEFFLLNETDVSGSLRRIPAAALGNIPFREILNPILLGVAAPFLAMWGTMMLDRKNIKFKRIVFTAGAAALAALLILVDHQIEVF